MQKKDEELESLVEKDENQENKKSDLVEETVFKNNPVIILKKNPDDKYPLSFGLGKARLIVANFKAIVDFIEKHNK